MKWPFARGTREPGWLVVSLQPGELSFVHGRYTPGGESIVDRCGTHALEGEYQGAERLAKELGFERYQCLTLLAPGEYQMLLVEAPNVPQTELKTAMRWRIKDMLEYHVDDATVDLLEVPRNPAGGERGHSMYAITARNEVIQSALQLKQDALELFLACAAGRGSQRQHAGLDAARKHQLAAEIDGQQAQVIAEI